MAEQRAIITDKLVVAQTGATLEEWYRHLDSLGAQKLKHVEIFDLVAGIEGLKPLGEWNHNLLTTSYEWDRGLKERGEKWNGFEISVSKTINAPLPALYNAFTDAAVRIKWLTANIDITKQTENKSARAMWSDGKSRLSVDFYTKGDAKSQIVVQHMKLLDSTMAREMKALWGSRLEKLKNLLEA